jgi:hypothetical protein
LPDRQTAHIYFFCIQDGPDCSVLFHGLLSFRVSIEVNVNRTIKVNTIIVYTSITNKKSTPQLIQQPIELAGIGPAEVFEDG